MEAGTVPVEDVEKMLDEEIIRDDGHRLTLRELLGPKLTALNYEARKVTGYKKHKTYEQHKLLMQMMHF